MEQRMIGYTKGIRRNPGDMMADDGELMECINLKCEGGELKPLLWPKEAGFSVGEGEELLYIHKGNGYKNYFVKGSGGQIKAFYISAGGEKKWIFDRSFIGDVKFDAVGNTLVLLDDAGVHYVLYKNNSYSYLGRKPPRLSLRFGLICEDGQRGEKSGVWSQVLTTPLPSLADYEDNPEGLRKARVDAVMAGVNKIYHDILSEGLFAGSFILRYAYRMYDGTSFMHSVPVLFPVHTYMSPFVIEKVELENVGIEDSAWALGLKLYYELDDDTSLASLKTDWADIVKGVDIAITPQVVCHEQDSDDLRMANIANVADGTDRWGIHNSYSVYHYPYGRTSKYGFIDTFSIDSQFAALAGANFGLMYFPELRSNGRVDEEVKNSSIFYKLAYVPVKSLATGMKKDVDVSGKDMNNIVTWERLDDDYQTNYALKADNLYVYNNRLNLSGVSVDISSPFSVNDFYPILESGGTGTSLSDAWVSLQYDMVYDEGLNGTMDSDRGLAYNRYFFYPDANAQSLVIKVSSLNGDNLTQYVNVPLEEHVGLNGSVYFNGFYADLPSSESAIRNASVGFVKTGKVYTSEVNNPFVFGASGVNTVGTGDMMRIVSNAKALSQGQFGQFPMIVFGSEGIWAMEVDGQGLYSAKQLISRDVCNNPDSIVQTDNLIFFSSERGLMAIDGSNVVCVSDGIKGLCGEVTDLPRVADFALKCGVDELIGMCDDGVGFRDYLKGCRIGYNYRDNALYIAHDGKGYVYVYDIDTKTYSKLCRFVTVGEGESATRQALMVKGFVNDYPDTLMLTDVGGLYSLLDEPDMDGDAERGFAMTRPLKLGSPMAMKRVKQVKHLKNLLSEDSWVKYGLWGSNDGIRWYHVTSYNGGMKYYRMGLFTNLKPRESLLGTVMLTEEKRTDKLR